MIIDHPQAFFLSLFLLSVGLGVWIGCSFAARRIQQLKQRIESLKLELAMLAPKRGMGLRLAPQQ